MSPSFPRARMGAWVAGASLLFVAVACDSSLTAPAASSSAPQPGLTIERGPSALRVGMTERLDATFVDDRGVAHAAAPTWRTEDATVATVSPDGTLLATGAGHAIVWAFAGTDSTALQVDVSPSASGETTLAPRNVPSLTTGTTSGVADVKWMALSSGTTRMAAGTTFQFVARALDATGKALSPAPAFLWGSSNPAIARIDSTGLVRSTAVGQAYITVRLKADTLGPQTGMVINVVDATAWKTASLSVTPTSVNVPVGGTVQITTTPRTSAGVAITGRTIKYTSLNTSRATVSSTGLVRAVATGSLTLLVACDGLTKQVPVEVVSATSSTTTTSTTAAAPTAARVVVAPASVALQAGASQALAATVYATDSSVMTGVNVAWSTSAPTVATIGTDGKVTAVAAGSATVTATVGTIKGSATVVVSAPTTSTAPTPTVSPTTLSGTKIPLTVQRFDGGTGPVMVSNGIPLTPGLVTTANLSQLHVVVNGAEQAVYVKPLAGHFRDGSLRAVLVQFDYDLPDATPIGGVLVIGGGARALPDLASRPAKQLPAAAALPSDPSYLVATRIGGALYAPSKTAAATSLMTQYEGDYVRLEAADWKLCGTNWSCGRTAGYDKSFITYTQWLRTGDPTFWHHATAEAADYLKNYIIPNQSPTPWWSQSEGVALHYWATGDEMSRYQLRKIAETLAWQVRPGQTYSIVGTYGDDRMRAKALFAALDAAMLEISTQPSDVGNYYALNGGTTYYAQFLTPSTLGTWIPGILATQKASGMFGGSQYGGGQSNYMVGMLLSGLIRYYEEVNADPRIPAAVKKCIDDLWANEWNASAQGFNYNSMRGTLANSTTTATLNPLPGLNGLITTSFAWYARLSGDATYTQRVDAQLAGLAVPTSRNWWPSSGKAFDEAFYRIFNTFAYRAGLP